MKKIPFGVLSGAAAAIVLFSALLKPEITLAVAFIALAALALYMFFLEKNYLAANWGKLAFLTLVALCVAAAIAASQMIIGNLNQARESKLDNVPAVAKDADDGGATVSEVTEAETPAMSIPVDSLDVKWEEAKNYFAYCLVKSAAQTHDRTVTITLFGGLTVKTTEPNIDDIITAAKEAENDCGPISIATE